MAGRLSDGGPTVLENVGLAVSKAVGARRGEPVSVIEVVDVVIVAGAAAVLVALAAEVRHARRQVAGR